MSEHDRRNEWTVLGAVALIVVGVWLLLARVPGPLAGPIGALLRFVAAIAWPLALIAAGVLLLIAGRRGVAAGVDVSGKRLYRSRNERLVGGVLGGLGAYLGVDPTWLRIGYVVITVLTGLGPAVLVYIIAMMIVPEEPKPSVAPPSWPGPEPSGTETVQVPTAPAAPEPPVAPGPPVAPIAPEPPVAPVTQAPPPPAPPPPVPNATEQPPAPPAPPAEPQD